MPYYALIYHNENDFDLYVCPDNEWQENPSFLANWLKENRCNKDDFALIIADSTYIKPFNNYIVLYYELLRISELENHFSPMISLSHEDIRNGHLIFDNSNYIID